MSPWVKHPLPCSISPTSSASQTPLSIFYSPYPPHTYPVNKSMEHTYHSNKTHTHKKRNETSSGHKTLCGGVLLPPSIIRIASSHMCSVRSFVSCGSFVCWRSSSFFFARPSDKCLYRNNCGGCWWYRTAIVQINIYVYVQTHTLSTERVRCRAKSPSVLAGWE